LTTDVGFGEGETCRFTVPPAVALLNYISCVILFSHSGILGGFSLHILSFALRISESAMGRGWEFKFSSAFIVIPVSWRMKMRED
jgi:hypothetical protein